MSTEKKDNNNRTARVILTIIAIVMIVVGVVWFGIYLKQQSDASQVPTNSIVDVPQDETVSQGNNSNQKPNLVNNPVDFKSIQSQNSEIYAWIKVPGTKVDYPMLQSAEADDFYLKHNAYNKQWQDSGSIYIQSHNTKTFRDRVTVVYGHNGYGDSMFTTLHYFEKEDFFKKNDKFYIYTPNSKLTYQIISAFKYDDRHILNSFDMKNDVVFGEFLDMIQNPDSVNKNVRTDLDKEITIDDKIVILSTCITNQKSNRYLVCGVLVNNEATN